MDQDTEARLMFAFPQPNKFSLIDLGQTVVKFDASLKCSAATTVVIPTSRHSLSDGSEFFRIITTMSETVLGHRTSKAKERNLEIQDIRVESVITFGTSNTMAYSRVKATSFEATSLVHGFKKHCSTMRYYHPFGHIFRFDSQDKPRRLNSAVMLSVVLVVSQSVFVNGATLLFLDPIIHNLKDLIIDSIFVRFCLKTVLAGYLFISTLSATMLISKQVKLSNIIASKNYLVSYEEQRRLAVISLTITIIKLVSYVLQCVHSVYFLDLPIEFLILIAIGMAEYTVLLETIRLAPIFFVCMLARLLGSHVRNFTALNVDTMFEISESHEKDVNMKDELIDAPKSIAGCSGIINSNVLRFNKMLSNIKEECIFVLESLNSRKYRELSIMKSVRLSEAMSRKITPEKRLANNLLIGSCLRKTQVMLRDLRDVVVELDKISSPCLLSSIIYETFIIILITTLAIQPTTTKYVKVFIIPTIAVLTGFITMVLYVCVSLDSVTSELKLMINKEFDFIIMNNRASIQQSSSRPSIGNEDKDLLSQIWSEFGYTRKLANTICFSLGGIITVDRRLALSIFGHVLSAVFISIETMNIVESLNKTTRVGAENDHLYELTINQTYSPKIHL